MEKNAAVPDGSEDDQLHAVPSVAWSRRLLSRTGVPWPRLYWTRVVVLVPLNMVLESLPLLFLFLVLSVHSLTIKERNDQHGGRPRSRRLDGARQRTWQLVVERSMSSSSGSDKERAPSQRWVDGSPAGATSSNTNKRCRHDVVKVGSSHPFCFSSFLFSRRCCLPEAGNTRGPLSPFQFFKPKVSSNRSIKILAQLFAGGPSVNP